LWGILPCLFSPWPGPSPTPPPPNWGERGRHIAFSIVPLPTCVLNPACLCPEGNRPTRVAGAYLVQHRLLFLFVPAVRFSLRGNGNPPFPTFSHPSTYGYDTSKAPYERTPPLRPADKVSFLSAPSPFSTFFSSSV